MVTDNRTSIPHLDTIDSLPILELEQQILKQQCHIEAWFRQRWSNQFMPITASVDLRNAGFKVCPIDTNVFPAGFNNLSQALLPLCIQAAQYYMAKYYPKCQRILIIAENHDRNPAYHDSLFRLQQIYQMAGYTVYVGRIDKSLLEPLLVTTQYGDLTIYPVLRKGNRLLADNFNACMVLLNRDLSEGIPKELEGIEQLVNPAVALGWFSRLKSTHFRHYQTIVKQFAKDFAVDAWQLMPEFTSLSGVDFMQTAGLSNLVKAVDDVLASTRQNYASHGIKQKPFAVVKADAGTYGMGVMMVTDADQLYNLNRKQRTKMSTRKGKQRIDRVIIQEGIPSLEQYQGAVAEPVVYLLGHSVVGGFYRMHKDKTIAENLNSPGMEFKPLAFSDACNTPVNMDAKPNRFYLYGVVARLALLAASMEMQGLDNVE